MVNIGKSHSGLREVVLIRRFVFVKTLGGCFKTLPLLFLNSTHFLQLFWQLNPLDQVFLIQGIPPIETRCIGKCPFPRHALYKPQTPSESVPTPSLYQPIYIYILPGVSPFELTGTPVLTCWPLPMNGTSCMDCFCILSKRWSTHCVESSNTCGWKFGIFFMKDWRILQPVGP